MQKRGIQRFGLWVLLLGGLSQCTPQNPWFEEKKDTGIDFINQVTESDRDNAIDFLYVYNGGGVGVADINGDQLPDLCFTGNQTPGKLYLNKGNFQFQDITDLLEKPITGWCTGVSWADINQDQFPDLIISRSGNVPETERTNLVYLNPGKLDATWPEVGAKIGLDQSGWTTQTLWFDFDRDGDLDGYILNASNEERYSNRVQFKRQGTGPASDRLLVNQWVETGQLAFVDQTEVCGIQDDSFGLGVTTGDFNHDGWVDLYVANDFLGHDLVYLNTGKKGFQEVSTAVLPYSSHFSMGCMVLDVNYDGLDDVFVADMLPSSADRRLRMTGPLTNESMQYVHENGYHRQFMRNTLQVQLDQRFIEVAQAFQVDQTDWSWSPVAADFSHDGLTDLFISNGYPRDITDMDFIAYNAELGQKEGRSKADQRIKELIRNQPSLAAENALFAGSESGFQSIGWSGEIDVSHAAIEADLDGDGALDLIINRLNAPVQIWKNTIAQEPNHFIELTLIGSSKHPLVHGSRVEFFDSNKRWTRQLQPVRGFQASALTPIHVGLGTVSVVDSVCITWPDGFRQVVRQVKSGKQKIERNDQQLLPPYPVRLLDNSDSTHFKAQALAFEPTVLQQDQLEPLELKGDWDQDGKPDLLLGGTLDRKTQIRFGNGKVWIRPKETPQWITDAQWADINQDGMLDLVLGGGGWMFEMNSTYSQNEVWLQQPKNTFQNSDVSFEPFPTRKLIVQDFDQNGYSDILVFPGRWLYQYGNWQKPVLWSQTQANRWTKEETSLPAGFYTDVLWTSQGIGWAVGELQPVRTFQYEQNKGFTVKEWPQTVGLWQCVAEVGANQVVLGNWGKNTALKQGPVHVWLADWDGNSLPDPIWVGPDQTFLGFREDLLKQLPMLKKPFSTYAYFAQSDAKNFAETVGKGDQPWVEVQELRSMFWDGKSLKALPEVAQWGILRRVEVDGPAQWRGYLSDKPLHVMNRGGGGEHVLFGYDQRITLREEKNINPKK